MNSVERTLVTSYATALFEAAKSKGVLEPVAAHAEALRSLLAKDEKLVTFMNAPNIGRDDKARLFEKAFKGRFNPLLVNFLELLVRRNRLNVLDDALEVFNDLYLRHQGVAPGTVTTAVALSETEKQSLNTALNAFSGKKLRLEFVVDPKVLGGVRFASGDTLVDNTLRASLHRLGRTLQGVKVY